MRLDVENNSNSVIHQQRTNGSSESVPAAVNVSDLLSFGVKAAQAGDRVEARAALLRVAELEPTNETAWLWLASISEYPEELLVFLNNVLAINPDNARASEWKSSTNSLLSKTFVQRGIDAAGADKIDFAVECFNRGIEYDQSNEMAWLWLASLANDPANRVSYLETVLKINPNNEAASKAFFKARREITSEHLAAAKKAAIEGKKDDAYELLLKVIEEDPACEDAWMLRSHFAEHLDEKILSFQRVLEINPANDAARYSLNSLGELIGIPAVDPSASSERPSFASEYHHSKENAYEPEIDRIPTQDLEIPAELAEEIRDLESRSLAELSESDHEAIGSSFEEAEPALAAVEPAASVTDAFSEKADAFEPVLEGGLFNFTDSGSEYKLEEPTAHAGELSQTPETLESVTIEAVIETDALSIESSFDNAADFAIAEPAELDTNIDSETEEEMFAVEVVEVSEEIEVPDVNDDGPKIYVSEALSKFEPETDPTSVDEPIDDDNDIAQSYVYASPEASTVEISVEKLQEVYDEVDVDPAIPYTVAESEEIEQPPFIARDEFVTNRSFEHIVPSNGDHLPEGSSEVDGLEPTDAASNISEQILIPASEPGSFEEVAEDPYKTVSSVTQADIAIVEAYDESPYVSEIEDNESEDFAEPLRATSVCSFCASYVDINPVSCSSCNGILTLSDLDLFRTDRAIKSDHIRSTVERWESELGQRPFSADELTKLAIGYLNLNDLQSGYSALSEAVKHDPENIVLASQVNSLLIKIEDVRRLEESSRSQVKGKTILVVDDSPTVRKLIGGKLEKSGHNVVSSADGVEALEALKTVRPDLILLDINMPKMDGYQTCKAIRSLPEVANVPVVMISGKDGFFDKVRGKMAGSSGYITKPFGPETLMKSVESFLASDHAQLEEQPAI